MIAICRNCKKKIKIKCKGLCTSCYNKNWILNNPNYHKIWKKNNKDKVRECAKRVRENHKEQYKKRSREWARKNKEWVKAYAKEYYKNNIEYYKAKNKKWRTNNKKRKAEVQRIRYHTKRGNGGSHTQQEWDEMVISFNNKCANPNCTTIYPYTLTRDHIIPITKGGTSNIDNIQPLCQSCNSTKRDKIIDYTRIWGSN